MREWSMAALSNANIEKCPAVKVGNSLWVPKNVFSSSAWVLPHPQNDWFHCQCTNLRISVCHVELAGYWCESLAELTAINQQNMPSQEIMLTKQFCWKSMSLPVSMSLFHLFSHMDHGIFHGSLECVSALATLLAPHQTALGRAEMAAATPSPSTQQKLSPAQL